MSGIQSMILGVKTWLQSTAYLGDGVGTYNGGASGSALLYGAHTTSGGAVAMPGTCYISTGYGPTSATLYSVNLSNTYFPLVPNITDGTALNPQVAYALGTGDVAPAYTYANVPIFVWRRQPSNWTDSMVQNALGLTSSQVAQVKYATQVWWENAFSSMNQQLWYALAILDSRNYMAGSPGNAWNNKTVVEFFYNDDVGGEWSSHGFIFAPTITNNVASGGVGAFTKTGSTGRDAGGVVGSLTNYCVTLDEYSLVVPVVKADSGFSGGARDSNRDPFSAKFGYIALT